MAMSDLLALDSEDIATTAKWVGTAAIIKTQRNLHGPDMRHDGN